MDVPRSFVGWLLGSLAGLMLLTAPVQADKQEWIDLLADLNTKGLHAFVKPSDQWIITDRVDLDSLNARKLSATPCEGNIIVNGAGRIPNLVTREKFQDVEVHVEFLISKGSNAGVKLMGRYEIQILDSWQKDKLTGDACGGIYPRAEYAPDKSNPRRRRYRHIDEGVAPKTNAALRPGQWQTLDITFRAPRFKEGKKVENARFVKVVLNGKVVQDNVEVKYPTGHAWNTVKEVPTGPLLLQADHGPVAFRHVRIRALKGE
jgi:hypothetical protein